ncbi:TonB-dependent receptor [Thermomonas hydrothermalis]|uniref:Catecholate siderophore receptor n=1 Tax=Thermomonas hydrothermalis TaxID=213588 RepID=A0A1M4Z6J6_9GAMM|nr:TonB-dependent siderophore receptor [Thermomonas hydrothermalis]SHF13620.1 catecholate siderophore receptor [Thermomonas hydrothermalis]
MSHLRLRPAPLTLAIALTLCAPVLAGEPGTEADAPEAAKDLAAVVVVGQRYLPEYQARTTRSATKTDTPLLDVPQAVTVVTDKLVADQGLTSLNDTFRYMPGVGTAQGEGNRDTPVMRGISSTGDFYVDGIRDDVQYFRDVYNLERAEALKGPSAMIFGRGGSGGVINRVTRVADGMEHRNATLQFGSYLRRRATLDVGQGLGTSAGIRVTAMAEDSDSFRDDVFLKRHGFNPSVNFSLGPATEVVLAYEHFHDDRTADRGVPSYQGRPLRTDPATFFGNPRLSRTEADVDAFDARLDHTFGEHLTLRNHLRLADYDKYYQNVFPGAVNATASTVTLSAYRSETARRNLFNQTDLVWDVRTGRVNHTLLAGLELGRQITDNRRLTGYFAPGANVVPVSQPNVDVAVDFRPSATDANNHIIARTSALYLQDQIELSPQWLMVLGVRRDDVRIELHDNRNGQVIRSDDTPLSPRAGLIYKPLPQVSLYASVSRAFQPRAGDQLGSLTASNASLAPEVFRNREIGAKWDIHPDLQASIALYRLTRSNVAVTDPNDPTRLLLVDGQYSKGVELGLAGHLTPHWQVMGGYAWQTGELTATQSATALKGNRLAQLPRQSASLWNRYDINDRIGVGLGVVYRGAIYASIDNTVTLPAFTRVDAALYWTLTPKLQVQLNVENLGNTRYYASTHNNNNISPGAPRSAWLTLNLHD